ncbi:MAG: hypothetical protein HY362_04610 [Candidatus Aenigmarchaeota archaeon]|nr:hypothetical protein [Candidatus Aenigmarchaeota archaeon]
MKANLWGIISWIFVICGLIAYGFAWTAMATGTKPFLIQPELFLYDAMVAGIFAIFFLIYAMHSNLVDNIKKKGR